MPDNVDLKKLQSENKLLSNQISILSRKIEDLSNVIKSHEHNGLDGSKQIRYTDFRTNSQNFIEAGHKILMSKQAFIQGVSTVDIDTNGRFSNYAGFGILNPNFDSVEPYNYYRDYLPEMSSTRWISVYVANPTSPSGFSEMKIPMFLAASSYPLPS